MINRLSFISSPFPVGLAFHARSPESRMMGSLRQAQLAAKSGVVFAGAYAAHKQCVWWGQPSTLAGPTWHR